MEKKRQFLPTLLERLQDDEPKNSRERYDAFFFNAKKMRSIVQNDISILLNNNNIEDNLDVHKHEMIANSVINYGIRNLTGNYNSQHKWFAFEQDIRTAILRFETRIIPESLIVRSLLSEEQPAKYGIILFEIRGLIEWDPHPIDLFFNGRYDIETSYAELKSM